MTIATEPAADERAPAALKRNLAELNNAILKRRALSGLHNAGSAHSLDFFRVAAHALFNDMIAHAINVFDRHRKAASIWFVAQAYGVAFDEAAAEQGLTRAMMTSLADKLAFIRVKTHFHIDADAVVEPRAVWAEAALRGRELGEMLDVTFATLSALQLRVLGLRAELPAYDGSDVRDIIYAYKAAHPNVPIAVGYSTQSDDADDEDPEPVDSP